MKTNKFRVHYATTSGDQSMVVWAQTSIDARKTVSTEFDGDAGFKIKTAEEIK